MMNIYIIFLLFFLSSILFIPIQDDDPVADCEEIVIKEFQENDLLVWSTFVTHGEIKGPEDLEFDESGNIYTGSEDGKICKISPSGSFKVIGRTTGRPLGLKLDKEKKNLIIADAINGLLSLNIDTGVFTILTSESDDGIKLLFTDNLVISEDNTIYFSDASFKHSLDHLILDFVSGVGYGRLLKFNPKTREITTLMKGIYFANGVALSKNEEFVLICETWKSRILRYWLKGPKNGTSDVFIDGLPGLPDNISYNGKDTFWIALVQPSKGFGLFIKPYPTIKRLIARLPKFLQNFSVPFGGVLGVDESGFNKMFLEESKGKVISSLTTTAKEYEGYLGSLLETQDIVKCKL